MQTKYPWWYTCLGIRTLDKLQLLIGKIRTLVFSYKEKHKQSFRFVDKNIFLKKILFSLLTDIIVFKIDMIIILSFKNNHMNNLVFSLESNSFLCKNKSCISLLLKPTDDKKWWQTKKTFLNLTLLRFTSNKVGHFYYTQITCC